MSAQLENELGSLRECLVISFAYNEAEQTFLLVTDFHEERTGRLVRGFFAARFEGVSKFERELGVQAAFRAAVHQYDSRSLPPMVIQDVKLQLHKVSFWFGYSVGGVSFQFKRVRTFHKRGLGEPVDAGWRYTDESTGAEFDFYAPFPEVTARVAPRPAHQRSRRVRR